jgi:hypothetical protein
VLAIWWEISYPLVEVTLAEWNVRVESSELPFLLEGLNLGRSVDWLGWSSLAEWDDLQEGV